MTKKRHRNRPPAATVAGEPLELLIRALREFEWEPEPDGMMHVWWELPPETGNPLFRALMRTEAALLRKDAKALGSPDYEDRTPAQRRHDALILLVQRIGAAVERSRRAA
jgi:hypothetical protein